MTAQPSTSATVASGAVTDAGVAHRTRSRTVQVVDPTGAPLAGVPVTVEQVRHEIAFGCIGFDETERAWRRLTGATPAPGEAELLDRLDELWFDLFDTATLPFYWGTFEPRQGTLRTAALREAAEHYVSRGARVKGHPLVWHTVAPRWLEAYPTRRCCGCCASACAVTRRSSRVSSTRGTPSTRSSSCPCSPRTRTR